MCILNLPNEVGEYVIHGNKVNCNLQPGSDEANQYLSLKASEAFSGLENKQLFVHVMRSIIDTAISQGILVKYDKWKLNVKRLLELQGKY